MPNLEGCGVGATHTPPASATWRRSGLNGQFSSSLIPKPSRGRRSLQGSDRGALFRPGRLSGVELPVALFDTASALVPGNGGADVVRASPLARCGDLLLRLARCQNKDPSLRVGGVRLPPAGLAVVVRRRPRGRAGAAAFVAVVG